MVLIQAVIKSNSEIKTIHMYARHLSTSIDKVKATKRGNINPLKEAMYQIVLAISCDERQYHQLISNTNRI